MLQIGEFWSAFCNNHNIHGCCFEKILTNMIIIEKNNVNCVFSTDGVLNYMEELDDYRKFGIVYNLLCFTALLPQF